MPELSPWWTDTFEGPQAGGGTRKCRGYEDVSAGFGVSLGTLLGPLGSSFGASEVGDREEKHPLELEGGRQNRDVESLSV